MFFNGRAKKNCLGEWCVLELIVRHGIVDCFLTHMGSIYLEFVLARGVALERFEKCQCEDDDVHFHCRTWVPDDDHYRWLRGPINPLPMEHQAEYLVCTIRCILNFLQCDLPPLSRLLSCNSPEAPQLKMLILKFDFDFI
jgi:hypothetical protein